MTLDQKIEGYLFFKGEPVSRAELSRFFKATETEVEEAIAALEAILAGRGIILLKKDDGIMLGTAAELGPLFEALRKEELSKELSKASLETLTIILYKGTATRSEIDYIRGVNSGFILRNLLVRGLVEKEIDSRDSRKYVYKPTFDLLSYMGISNTEELPEFYAIQKALNEHYVPEESTESENLQEDNKEITQ